MLELANMFFV